MSTSPRTWATEPAGARGRRARGGFSLMIVMVAISTCLVLTLSFLQTQSVSLQIRGNVQRRDLALHAAQSGAAAALREIQQPAWAGVSVPLSRTIGTDSLGMTSYRVEFLADPTATALGPESALRLLIRSTGRWDSAERAGEAVQRTVELTVQLQPRAPGRSIHVGDSAAATDIAANPSALITQPPWALVATGAGTSLNLDPGSRVDGPAWVRGHVSLFEDPAWSVLVRRAVLQSVGQTLAGGGVFRHPHPLAGAMTLSTNPTEGLKRDLGDLGVPWVKVTDAPTAPAIDFSSWQTYRLYNGGFQYSAGALPALLQNVTLRPTPDNPLGVFYRNGDVEIRDQVTVQGTLVATGEVRISGRDVRLAAFNWRGGQGVVRASGADLWPRLPTIVADRLFAERDARATVDGGVVLRHSFQGAGGRYELESGTDPSVAGTATAAPLEQPLSLVQLQGAPDLAGVAADGRHAVWLASGETGRWYRIVGVNASAKTLTVVGEARRPAAAPFRIGRCRSRYLDVEGPVLAETMDLYRLEDWVLTGALWEGRLASWQNLNNLLRNFNLPQIAFTDWLGSPLSFSGWSFPYGTYGLPLEPTFNLRNTTDVSYHWSPPLFAPFSGTGADAVHSGYRWKVLSWRETP